MAKQPAKGRKTPAKPRKATQSKAAIPESVAAVEPVVDAIPPEVHAPEVLETLELVEPVEVESVPVVDETPVPDVEKVSAEQVETPAPAKAPEQSSGAGFLPLLLGGVLAGVIGFVIATFTAPSVDNTLADQVAMQSSTLSSLEEQVAGLPAVDVASIDVAQADLSAKMDELDTTLVDIGVRVTALEERPAGNGISSAAGEGVADEMDALRAQIAEMTGAAQTELAEARAQAASIEENAAAAARNAAARAALSRVQTALESGAPVGAALGDLEEAIGESAPDALIAVQDGVPTLASLQEQFPEVARAALTTARSEGVSGEETTGLGAFMRNQFDVRSTSPQEGDSADAVLSRAEAAVRTGRLSDALAEISALPEVARAEMSEWLGLAETRADAIAAVDILSTSLSDN